MSGCTHGSHPPPTVCHPPLAFSRHPTLYSARSRIRRPSSACQGRLPPHGGTLCAILLTLTLLALTGCSGSSGLAESSPAQATTAPVVTAPVAITIEATGATTAVDLGQATAVDGDLPVSNDAPADGFAVGVTFTRGQSIELGLAVTSSPRCRARV